MQWRKTASETNSSKYRTAGGTWNLCTCLKEQGFLRMHECRFRGKDIFLLCFPILNHCLRFIRSPDHKTQTGQRPPGLQHTSPLSSISGCPIIGQIRGSWKPTWNNKLRPLSDFIRSVKGIIIHIRQGHSYQKYYKTSYCKKSKQKVIFLCRKYCKY